MSGEKLSYYYPNAQWAWASEDIYATLEWFGPGDKPSQAEIAALEWPVDILKPEVTKLQIRDEAVAQGIWASFKTFIEADAARKERWGLAVAVATDDPILDAAQAALEWTDAERKAFLVAAGKR